jgi:hypothetical protein
VAICRGVASNFAAIDQQFRLLFFDVSLPELASKLSD